MRKLKAAMGPYVVPKEVFDSGRRRKLQVIMRPDGAYVHASGLAGWRCLPWGVIYDKAAAAEAGFDPSPRKGLLRRGAVS